MRKFHKLDILISWYKEYLLLKNYRERTIKEYLFQLSFFRRYLKEETDVNDINEINRQTITNYQSKIYQSGITMQTLSTKLTAIKSFFQTLYTENKLYINPAEDITLPKCRVSYGTGLLTEEEINRIFEYFENYSVKIRDIKIETTQSYMLHLRNHAIVELLYTTGIRKEEMIKLQIDDIDFTENILRVREGKGGKGRLVPIGEPSIQTLKRYLKESRPYLNNNQNNTLFLNSRGNILDRYGYLLVVKQAAEKAGIKKRVTVHGIRHSCATHMLNNGADIRYIQELLGHTNLATTEQYTHLSIKDLKKAHSKYHPREKD